MDGVTVTRFEEKRDYYLSLLHQKLKDGSYRPRPVRPVEIDKPGSTAKRALGIPTVMDRCASRRWSRFWDRSLSRRSETRALAFGLDDRPIWPCGASGGS